MCGVFICIDCSKVAPCLTAALACFTAALACVTCLVRYTLCPPPSHPTTHHLTSLLVENLVVNVVCDIAFIFRCKVGICQWKLFLCHCVYLWDCGKDMSR